MLAFSFLYFYQEFYLYKCPDDACIKAHQTSILTKCGTMISFYSLGASQQTGIHFSI